jgi:serine/threonine protein phosphatase PrpC
MVEDDEIEYIIRKGESLQQAGEALIERANLNGGSDNITAVLVEI